MTVPGVPRDPAQGGEVGAHDEVAVAALPGRHRVAVDGVHVDVDGEQVVAALGAVRQDLVEEERRGTRLPWSLPCMSVNARTTVSMRPSATSALSCSTETGAPAGAAWSDMGLPFDGCPTPCRFRR